MKKAWLALIFGSALFLAACGGGDETNDTDTNTNDTNTEETANNEGTDTGTDTGTDEGTTEENAGGETASVDAEGIVQQSCTTCHGGNLQGMGNTPGLADVGSRLSQEEILNILQNGQNGMPGGLLASQGEEVEQAVAEYLANQK